MPRSDLRVHALLLAAVLLAGSAIGGGRAAEQGHIAAKVGKPVAPRNLLGRRTPPSIPAERIRPNAIGVVPARPAFETAAHATAPTPRFPAVGATNGVGLVKPGAGLETLHQPQLHTTPTLPPVILSRPAISGTSITRAGSAPVAIGGPAKTVGRISGTAFRPKR
jgi:hypothetical protein